MTGGGSWTQLVRGTSRGRPGARQEVVVGPSWSEHYGSQCAGVTGARVFATTWPKAVDGEVKMAAE
jgi:hypothetical protein